MIELLLLLLSIPLMSWLDRQRGTPREFELITKSAALAGMGVLTAVLVGHWLDWQMLAITAAVMVIHNFSFGEPMGHALTGRGGQMADDGTTYEIWQVTALLRENPWVALGLRGLVTGLAGVAVLEPVTAVMIALAFGLAFPLAPAIVRYLLKLPVNSGKAAGKAWAVNEYIRGGLVGALLVGMSLV